MWTLIVIVSLSVFVASLAGLLFKYTREKAKAFAGMSALVTILAGIFLASEQEYKAPRLGFSENNDQRTGAKAGVTNTGQATNVRAPGNNGRARICVTKDVGFDSYREIKLPAKTVFKDSGHLEGDVRDPWTPSRDANDDRWAAFITTDPVTLTKTEPCAEVGVRMLVGTLFKESSASAADPRVWHIEDVLEYSPASGPPPVEFGKLIDDISVRAVLLTDAGDPLVLAKEQTDEAVQAATCLAEAQKVAAHEKGVVGRQTNSVVFISHPAASEFSFGCGIDGLKPDVFIAWNKSRPHPSTVKLIASAGAFLTGAPAEDTKRELNECINEALKPDSGELSEREFDGGVRVECQAFERDGGGGSVTILRRFGSYPVHEMPSGKILEEMKRASAALATAEEAEAAKSLEFAKWWLDPAIPTKVKTFLILTARVQALADRCPTWKPDYKVITNAAAFAGVSLEEIKPGGKYFDTFADILAGMKKGTETENRDEACATAKKNYGDARRR